MTWLSIAYLFLHQECLRRLISSYTTSKKGKKNAQRAQKRRHQRKHLGDVRSQNAQGNHQSMFVLWNFQVFHLTQIPTSMEITDQPLLPWTLEFAGSVIFRGEVNVPLQMFQLSDFVTTNHYIASWFKGAHCPFPSLVDPFGLLG